MSDPPAPGEDATPRNRPSPLQSHSALHQTRGTHMSQSYQGRCFCGAVEIEVTGEAAGAGYCHCGSCRSWSAGPVNAFTLWKTDSVKVTKGADKVGEFHKSSNSYRKWCTA